MSEHRAYVRWNRRSPDFVYETYDRTHSIRFEGGIECEGSAAPEFMGKKECVNPEELLAAALSSCHMLTFLGIAAKKRFVVDSYTDRAVGVMAPNEKGKLFVSKVTLDPEIVFSGEKIPTPEQVADMHHLAHKECFIANSVLTEIVVAGIPSH